MRISKVILFILIASFLSCENNQSQKKHADVDQKNIKDGIRKYYFDNGALKSEVPYKDGKRNGICKNYYESGKVNLQVDYKDGVKDGISIWYYENGNKYMESPYVEGKMDGEKKIFYESGNRKAIIPYKNGYEGKGLIEYTKSGKVKKQYPHIVIEESNELVYNDRFTLSISLSNKSKKVKFYIGKLFEGKFLDGSQYEIFARNGIGIKEYNIPVGGYFMEKINIVAVYKTNDGNPYVITKSHNLVAENKGI